MIEHNCATCTHFKESRDEGIGTCRRYPPVFIEHEELSNGTFYEVWRQPDVCDIDICGEHRPCLPSQTVAVRSAS